MTTVNILLHPVAPLPDINPMQNPGSAVLADCISSEMVKLTLTGINRDEVLEELINLIPGLVEQPEAHWKLLHALQEREQLYSTGIGDGIALPHARNALVGLVHKPIIVIGRHPQGIPYGSIDGVPARLFFLLVAPTVTQHLAVLARLSRLLRDPKLRQNLFTADKPEKVISLIREAETEK